MVQNWTLFYCSTDSGELTFYFPSKNCPFHSFRLNLILKNNQFSVCDHISVYFSSIVVKSSNKKSNLTVHAMHPWTANISPHTHSRHVWIVNEPLPWHWNPCFPKPLWTENRDEKFEEFADRDTLHIKISSRKH